MSGDQPVEVGCFVELVLEGAPALLENLEHHVVAQVEYEVGHFVAVQVGVVQRLSGRGAQEPESDQQAIRRAHHS